LKRTGEQEIDVRTRALRASLVVMVTAVPGTGCKVFESPTSIAAAITFQVEPDPVTAEESTDPAFQYFASFTTTLTQTATTGGTIGEVTAVVKEASDGVEVVSDQPVTSHVDVVSGAERLEPGASVPITFRIAYALPGGGREALVDITVQFTADTGTVANAVKRVSVV
jgi:hypothetical protein